MRETNEAKAGDRRLIYLTSVNWSVDHGSFYDGNNRHYWLDAPVTTGEHPKPKWLEVGNVVMVEFTGNPTIWADETPTIHLTWRYVEDEE